MAHALTEATVADATTALELLEAVDGGLASVTGDAAYDTVAFYEAAGDRGATVVVPPTKTAKVSGRRPRSSARDRTIRKVRQIGRRRWKKVSGYHRQAACENAFFRYKSIIGEAFERGVQADKSPRRCLACNVLNQMTTLGRPRSYRYRSVRGRCCGSLRLVSLFMHQRPPPRWRARFGCSTCRRCRPPAVETLWRRLRRRRVTCCRSSR